MELRTLHFSTAITSIMFALASLGCYTLGCLSVSGLSSNTESAKIVKMNNKKEMVMQKCIVACKLHVMKQVSTIFMHGCAYLRGDCQVSAVPTAHSHIL